MHSGVIADRNGRQIARWVFSDRSGGFSHPPYESLNLATHVGDAPLAVAANRSRLADAISLPVDRLVFPGLVHSVDTGIVDSPIGLFPDVDILVTTQRKIGLVTLGADCVPMIVVDAEKKVALTAHVGWRGAADGMTDSIAAALAQAGGSVKGATVLLGPAICGQCYSVDAERREKVLAALPAAGNRSENGIDLRDGLEAVLKGLGARVQRVGGCTAEDQSLFSHRRDGVTGRQAAVVVLT